MISATTLALSVGPWCQASARAVTGREFGEVSAVLDGGRGVEMIGDLGCRVGCRQTSAEQGVGRFAGLCGRHARPL
ncbi:MAG TPA: hypothetical protein VK659_26725 [Asanoa sp.]|nr:hypothetical protein [Asanoa sp.]